MSKPKWKKDKEQYEGLRGYFSDNFIDTEKKRIDLNYRRKRNKQAKRERE